MGKSSRANGKRKTQSTPASPQGDRPKKVPPTPPGRRTQQDPDALTPAQELFVAAYLNNGANGTRAYMESHPRASVLTAGVEACKLLREPKIAARLAGGRAEQFKRWAMQGDEAIGLLAIRARANLAHIPRDAKGVMLPIELWPEDLQLAVREVKDGEVKLYDGLKAAELMAVATGRLRSKLDVDHTFNHLDLLAGSDKPPEE